MKGGKGEGKNITRNIKARAEKINHQAETKRKDKHIDHGQKELPDSTTHASH